MAKRVKPIKLDIDFVHKVGQLGLANREVEQKRLREKAGKTETGVIKQNSGQSSEDESEEDSDEDDGRKLRPRDEPASWRRRDSNDPQLWVVYLRAENEDGSGSGPSQVIYLNNVQKTAQWIKVATITSWVGWGANQNVSWTASYIDNFTMGSVYALNYELLQQYYQDYVKKGVFTSYITSASGNVWGAAGEVDPDYPSIYDIYDRPSKIYSPTWCGPILPPDRIPTVEPFFSEYEGYKIRTCRRFIGQGPLSDGGDSFQPTESVWDPYTWWGWSITEYVPQEIRPLDKVEFTRFPSWPKLSRLMYGIQGFGTGYLEITAADSTYAASAHVNPWCLLKGWAALRYNALHVDWQNYRTPYIRVTRQDTHGVALAGDYYVLNSERTATIRISSEDKPVPKTLISGLYACTAGNIFFDPWPYPFRFAWGRDVISEDEFSAIGASKIQVAFDTNLANDQEVKGRIMSILGRPDDQGIARTEVPLGREEWDWSSGEFTILGVALM